MQRSLVNKARNRVVMFVGIIGTVLTSTAVSTSASTVNDTFSDGQRIGRDTNTVPGAIEWYARKSSTSLSVASNSVIGGGQALSVDTAEKGSPIVGHFGPVSIDDVGNFIELTFDLKADKLTNNSNNRFRFGLFQADTLTTADGQSHSDSYFGYASSNRADGRSGRDAAKELFAHEAFPSYPLGFEDTDQNFGSHNTISANDPIGTVYIHDLNTKYRFSLRIERTAMDELTLTTTFSDGQTVDELSGTWNDSQVQQFNTIGFGNFYNEFDYTIDNVKVVVPGPATLGTFGLMGGIIYVRRPKQRRRSELSKTP